MNIEEHSKYLTKHFYTVLGIGIIWSYLDSYGLLFFMLASFPVFFILFQYYFYSFSNELRKERPDLFERYSLSYSILKGDVISVFSLFDNSDFKELQPVELKNRYKLTLKALKLALISFGLILPMAIILI